MATLSGNTCYKTQFDVRIANHETLWKLETSSSSNTKGIFFNFYSWFMISVFKYEVEVFMRFNTYNQLERAPNLVESIKWNVKSYFDSKTVWFDFLFKAQCHIQKRRNVIHLETDGKVFGSLWLPVYTIFTFY